jgi:hypothetical protein
MYFFYFFYAKSRFLCIFAGGMWQTTFADFDEHALYFVRPQYGTCTGTGYRTVVFLSTSSTVIEENDGVTFLFLQVVQSGLVPSLLAYLTRPDPEVGHSAHPTTLNTSQGISIVKSFTARYVQFA